LDSKQKKIAGKLAEQFGASSVPIIHLSDIKDNDLQFVDSYQTFKKNAPIFSSTKKKNSKFSRIII
jgi:hypothetical protein